MSDKPKEVDAKKEPSAGLSEEWLRLIYEITWEQYKHEDELRHNKNVLYISIQTALFAILPTSISYLIEIKPYPVGDFHINVALICTAIVLIATAKLGMQINKYWENVIRSGRAWLYLRYATARSIEHYAEIEAIGLATHEHNWDTLCKAEKKPHADLDTRRLKPFEHISELSNVVLYPKPPMGESHAALRMARTLNVLWKGVSIAAAIVIVLACFL